jgi:phospholipid transport system substrate-binding protein
MENLPKIEGNGNMRVMRWVVVVLALFVTGAAQAQAPRPGVAAQFIKAMGDEAISTLRAANMPLEAREAKFRALLARGFDMAFIGRFVLGPYWRTATPDQQQEYLQAFNDYVLDVYSARLGGYAGETLTVVGERPAGARDTMVNTRIDRPSGPPLEAQWRVRAMEVGPRIIDVVVEGVSMAATQRDVFAAVVHRQKVSGLIDVLRARTNKLPAAR